MPDEVCYEGCKALKLYPSLQGKREGLFLPCCSPVGRSGICVMCDKSKFSEKYGDLKDRLEQRGKPFLSKNNKQEVPYEKWLSETKKYNFEKMKQDAKKHKIKLSIFHEKKRERTPSTSSDEDDEKDKEHEETNKEHDEEEDEDEDKYMVKRKIEYKGTEYYVTVSNTIYNEDGDVVGVIDGDGEAQWNI
jgi:hypothetical protein